MIPTVYKEGKSVTVGYKQVRIKNGCYNVARTARIWVQLESPRTILYLQFLENTAVANVVSKYIIACSPTLLIAKLYLLSFIFAIAER